jgi:hypothetical protein
MSNDFKDIAQYFGKQYAQLTAERIKGRGASILPSGGGYYSIYMDGYTSGVTVALHKALWGVK